MILSRRSAAVTDDRLLQIFGSLPISIKKDKKRVHVSLQEQIAPNKKAKLIQTEQVYAPPPSPNHKLEKGKESDTNTQIDTDGLSLSIINLLDSKLEEEEGTDQEEEEEEEDEEEEEEEDDLQDSDFEDNSDQEKYQKGRSRIPKSKSLKNASPVVELPGSPKVIYKGDPNKYQVILADPPWFYKNRNVEGSCARHYEMLTDKQLYELDIIKKISDPKHCALLLWCTGPKLDVGIKLLSKWGFTFKTIFFTWCKTNKQGQVFPGLGYYTRSSTELCLLGVRGNVLQWKRNKNVMQTILARRRQHSRKPDEARKRIEQFFIEDVRKFEMFARQSAPGWDSWGNEVTKFDLEK